jgi:hypothetical protein
VDIYSSLKWGENESFFHRNVRNRFFLEFFLESMWIIKGISHFLPLSQAMSIGYMKEIYHEG